MFYIVYNKSYDAKHYHTGENLKDYVYVKDSEDNVVELVTIDELRCYLDKGLFIGGVDEVNGDYSFRPTTNKPYFYDWCIANNRLDILEQLQDKELAKTITIGSKVYANWRCKNGHTWRARIDSRIFYNQGCRQCLDETIGIGTSFSEQRYYFYLKKYIDDLQNRVKIAGYEADLVSEKHKLVIEYDGGFHRDDKNPKDELKTRLFIEKGYRVIRIRGRGAKDYSICGEVLLFDEEKISYLDILNSIISYLGIRDTIYPVMNEQMVVLRMFRKVNQNSVLKTNKDRLDKYYCYDLNKNLDLDIISKGSDIEAFWKCSLCGGVYKRSFHQVLRGYDSCINCKDLKMLYTRLNKYGNALKEKYPELEKWYSVNNKYPFDAIACSSQILIKFKCPNCSFEFSDYLRHIIPKMKICCCKCKKVDLLRR